MNDSLFPSEFPLIINNNDLEKVKNQHPDYDPYFVASGCIKERREKFDSLWNEYKQLLDEKKTKIFLSKIKHNGQFHENTWEMYLGCILKKHFSNVSTASQDKGIDFTLHVPEEIFIEAVACKKGEPPNAVPDMIVAERLEDIAVHNVPHDEMLLRISNSISYKAKQHKDFIASQKKPYIISVNKGGLEHIEPEIPLILKCLFGVGHPQLSLDKDGKFLGSGWSRREFIEKKNGQKVSMKFFEEEENRFVSAIIYSSNTVLSAPTNIGEDCIIVHNPKATIPIDHKVFSFLCQWESKAVSNGFQLNKIKPG